MSVTINQFNALLLYESILFTDSKLVNGSVLYRYKSKNLNMVKKFIFFLVTYFKKLNFHLFEIIQLHVK